MQRFAPGLTFHIPAGRAAPTSETQQLSTHLQLRNYNYSYLRRRQPPQPKRQRVASGPAHASSGSGSGSYVSAPQSQ
eukprot:2826309-Pyramimonas_sp.AAC.4